MKLAQAGLLLSFVGALTMAGCSSVSKIPYTTGAHLRSTPDTVVLGHVPSGRKPVLTVKSGQVVRIDTISHQGVNNSNKGYVMGMDVDLDNAMKEAVQETVDFLGRNRSLSPQDAYSLASTFTRPAR